VQLDILRFVNAIWVVVAIYWIVAAGRAKPAAKRQSPASRALHIAILLSAYVFLWTGFTRIGILKNRFVPAEGWGAWLGLALTIAGCAFAIWARVYLGSNWSGTVTVKQNHELVRSGPYAIVRHPIYSGFLLALAGTAIVVGEIRALVGLGLAITGFLLKAGYEEQFMLEQFDGEYVRYSQQVRRLIPFLL